MSRPFDRDGGLPPMLPPRPPLGVRRPVAGVWCGTPGHAGAVLRAETERALDRATHQWRCPRCGRGDW